jgi:hypothetical protein
VRRRRRTKTSRSARATIPIGAARVTMKTICDHVGGVSSLSAGVWPTGKARCCRTLASGRGVVTTFRATGATVPRGSIDRPRDDREEVEPRPESSGNSRHSCCSSGGCASRRCAPLSAGPASASTIATTAIPTRWLLPSRSNVRSKIGPWYARPAKAARITGKSYDNEFYADPLYPSRRTTNACMQRKCLLASNAPSPGSGGCFWSRRSR